MLNNLLAYITSENIYLAANWGVIPFWLLLIFVPNNGFTNFLVQSILNQNITIYGDGSQTRSFCYVDDLIQGLMGLMNEDKINPTPLNLGNPNEFTIRELAEHILKITKSKSNISFHDLPLDDPKIRKPDIKSAKQRINWEPRIQLLEGLERTYNYFKHILI